MKKNVDKLIKLYEEYKKIHNYAEGGKVPHNKANLKNLQGSFNQFINEEKAEKYSDGGQVKDNTKQDDQTDKKDEAQDKSNADFSNAKRAHKELVKSMQEDIPEPGYDDGGQVQNDSYNKYYAHQDSYGKPTPSPSPDQVNVDPNKAAQFQKGFRKSLGFDDGGQVPPVQNPPTQQVDFEDPSVITAQAPQQGDPDAQPTSLQDVQEPQSPDDKALEEQMANEDFEAKEAADKDSTPDDDTKPEDTEEKPEDKTDEEQPADDKKPDEDEDTSSSATRLLEALKPGKSLSGDDLKEAQRQRDQNIALNQLERGSAIMGAGMARANPNLVLGAIADKEKYAGLPVQKYEELVANQQNDPTSPMSSVMRQYLASKGMKVPDNASAADLLKVAPFLAKDQALQNSLQKTMLGLASKQSEGEKNRDLRDKTAQAQQKLYASRTAATLEAGKARAGSLNDRTMYNQMQNLTKDLAQGGGTPVNLQRTNLVRAQNLFLTNGIDPKISPDDIDKIPNDQLNKINKINVIENGIELNRLLSGSNQAAQTTLNKLVPNNLNMSAVQIQDYISNRLNPANQAQALKSYMKIAARVRDQSQANVKKYQLQRLSGAGYLLDKFPDNAKSLMMEHGLDPSELKSNQTQQKAPSVNMKDQQALQHYQTMPDTDPSKAALGKILQGKGLIQ